MKIIVGAYASAPTDRPWDSSVEAGFLRGVMSIDGVAGLEVPWNGQLHPEDPSWLLGVIEPHWDIVLTDITGIYQRQAVDPDMGLASTDDDGRQRALRDIARLRDAAQAINEKAGRSAVRSIELHSAPSRVSGRSHPDQLANSLQEVASWDWGGAGILVEHCDALVAGRDPAKGFLALDDELNAIEMVNEEIGLGINWGRSAIELREPDGVPSHIDAAVGRGVLRALVFSGVTAIDTAYGPAWSDAHTPFAPGGGLDVGEPSSLLTVERASTCLAHAGGVDWVGVKMGWRGQPPAPRGALEMLTSAVSAVRQFADSQTDAAGPRNPPI